MYGIEYVYIKELDQSTVPVLSYCEVIVVRVVRELEPKIVRGYFPLLQ